MITARENMLWKYRYWIAAMVLTVVYLAVATASFAQETVPTLAVDSDTIQLGLFTGANVILVALGSIFFLLLGFAFGGKILKAIGDFIMRFSF